MIRGFAWKRKMADFLNVENQLESINFGLHISYLGQFNAGFLADILIITCPYTRNARFCTVLQGREKRV